MTELELKWIYGNNFSNIRKLVATSKEYRQIFYTAKILWILGFTFEISTYGAVGITLRCDPLAITIKINANEKDD